RPTPAWLTGDRSTTDAVGAPTVAWTECHPVSAQVRTIRICRDPGVTHRDSPYEARGRPVVPLIEWAGDYRSMCQQGPSGWWPWMMMCSTIMRAWARGTVSRLS